ncbi:MULTISPECIES: methyltransferase domain-containing protein [unclassified Cellulophaga]|uniref:methyltransferase domain-containing protein n=1 Tax=unclassified Cellulophaga TaxID=2634405 RepID=UPI0026E331D1|nr:MULTISPECIES: methyltransferase domain-containing protein [unclassified Cellulophaga]MDO6490507.1 methyltransferase domain-containing protein [Cellulophaga sp. 2_MG-2023]MDO6494299.1 methyltransferase domain-containing protein [Cellulophaga sp. 3_MG-2023]
MVTKRKKFQGVRNILSFNRHFYILGLLILVILITAILLLKLPVIILWVTVNLFVYGLVTPLLVSAYVYDFSGYYNFKWLQTHINKSSSIKKIVNINAGFDETSFILKKNFPTSDIKVFDFYNKKQHTEPAIVRARKVSLTYPNTQQITTSKIPLKDQSIDLVFLLSAAHEIRCNKEKEVFLTECKRICKPEGKIIMVEHLRDVPNFLAFSIGFTHFFSKKTWQNAFKNAGLSKIKEVKFTPFMTVFNYSK